MCDALWPVIKYWIWKCYWAVKCRRESLKKKFNLKPHLSLSHKIDEYATCVKDCWVSSVDGMSLSCPIHFPLQGKLIPLRLLMFRKHRTQGHRTQEHRTQDTRGRRYIWVEDTPSTQIGPSQDFDVPQTQALKYKVSQGWLQIKIDGIIFKSKWYTRMESTRSSWLNCYVT